MRSSKSSKFDLLAHEQEGFEFLEMYYKVYQLDGLDWTDKTLTLHGEKILRTTLENRTHASIYTEDAVSKSKLLSSKITMLAVFLRLPLTTKPYEDEHQNQRWPEPSLTNIFKSLIGFHDEPLLSSEVIKGKTSRLLANALLDTAIAIPLLLWNLLFIIPNIVISILKIVTELLPGLLYTALDKWAASAYENENFLVHDLLKIASIAVKGIFFVGRALTSPITGARDAWKLGNQLGGWQGKVVGTVLALLSLSITATAYIFAMPFAFKVVGPVLMSQLPAVVAPYVATALAYVGQGAVGVLAHIGIASLSSTITLGLTLMSSSLLTICNSQPLITKGLNKAKNWLLNAVADRDVEDKIILERERLEQESTSFVTTCFMWKYLNYEQPKLILGREKSSAFTKKQDISDTKLDTEDEEYPSYTRQELCDGIKLRNSKKGQGDDSGSKEFGGNIYEYHSLDDDKDNEGNEKRDEFRYRSK